MTKIIFTVLAYVSLIVFSQCKVFGDDTKSERKDFADIKVKAEKGSPEFQFKLGEIYRNGRGVEKDATEAVKCYKKAADQGFAEAQYSLGWSHVSGVGIKQDYK